MAARPSLIAIDGPVAVGKTSLGKLLARQLGYKFVDTGNMYRALTWKALKLGLDLDQEEKLGEMAERARMEPWGEDGFLVDGEEVGKELRSQEVEKGVSLVACHPRVRLAMVALQQRLAQEGRVVMVGRDIGTVVLPQAQAKFFLTASPGERARRRFRELKEQGQNPDYEAVLKDLERRDGIDSKRSHSPLRPAPEARILDTDGLILEEVARKVLSLLEGS
jgi:cytidylate kinase